MHTLFLSNRTRLFLAILTTLMVVAMALITPLTSHAETNTRPTLKNADEVLNALSEAGATSDFLSAVQKALGMLETINGLFKSFSGKSGGADEPCEGVAVQLWDTPNCKQVKSGLGTAGSGSSGALSDISSVIDKMSSVKSLIDQFQQLAGGGGSSGSGSTSGNNTNDLSAADYDKRFSAKTSEIQDKLSSTLSALGNIDTSRLSKDGSIADPETEKKVQTLASDLQSTLAGLTSDNYQVTGVPVNTTNDSTTSGIGSKISSFLNKLNPFTPSDDETSNSAPVNMTTFTMDDVDTITAHYVDPDSRVADEEYYVYTVTLNSGEVRKISLPAFAPISSQLDRLAQYGYRGSALEFLGAATQETIDFGLDQIASVTVANLDPLADRQIDNYKEFTIKLTSDIIYLVHVHADMDPSQVEINFRKTGYTGDIEALIAMATQTDNIGDVSFFSRIKHLVISGINNVLALFTKDPKDNYTEFPISKPQFKPDYFSGTDDFKAEPNTGESPLEVTFTVNHPSTTLIFGDGTMQSVSCETSVPEDTSRYGLDDVESIVYGDISLPNDEWHRIYKIKLKDDSVRTAHHWSAQPLENMWQSFRDSGYTGDIQDLRDMADFIQGEDWLLSTNDNNPNGTCVKPTTVTHTYNQDLTYLAKLYIGKIDNCDEVCDANIQFPTSSELGRISIVVGNQEPGPSGKFSASPAFGQSPLTVKFTTTYGDNSQYRPSMTDAADTLIDFGDGSKYQWVHCSYIYESQGSSDTGSVSAAYQCGFSENKDSDFDNTHTYSQDGTYTARIIKTGGMCLGACPVTELARLNIVVGDQAQDPNFTADPTSGSAPLEVTFTSRYGIPIGPDYINANKMTLNFGDGSDPVNLECNPGEPDPPLSDGQVCSTDAKLCPDGSYVTRTGPSCTFAACPLAGDPGSGNFCTADAKICPDGSSVGRVAPNCDFAACPSEVTPISDGSTEDLCRSYVCCTGDNCPLGLPQQCAGLTTADLRCETTGNGKSCKSDGKIYPEGATLHDIVDENGIGTSIADGIYICKNGKWTVSGSLPPAPTEPYPTCKVPTKTSHTYEKPGSYSAYLEYDPGLCNETTSCEPQKIATVQINVDENPNPTPNDTNEITFEVRTLGVSGSLVAGEGASAPTAPGAWTTGPLTITSGQQIAFRWDGSKYESCIPFLGDSGLYALTRRGDTHLLTGNTEEEKYDVNERTGEYRIECGGQENGEDGVDTKTIKVTVQNGSGDFGGGGGDLNGSGTNF